MSKSSETGSRLGSVKADAAQVQTSDRRARRQRSSRRRSDGRGRSQSFYSAIVRTEIVRAKPARRKLWSELTDYASFAASPR